MTLTEKKEKLQKLKTKLQQLEARAELFGTTDELNWLMYDKKPYQVDKYALLSKIFIIEQEIAITEENLRFRKEFKRVGAVIKVLERIEKIAIEKNSKIATIISEEIAKREWEDKEGHPYKLKGEKNENK